jgi:hypothetical protein
VNSCNVTPDNTSDTVTSNFDVLAWTFGYQKIIVCLSLPFRLVIVLSVLLRNWQQKYTRQRKTKQKHSTIISAVSWLLRRRQNLYLKKLPIRLKHHTCCSSFEVSVFSNYVLLIFLVFVLLCPIMCLLLDTTVRKQTQIT